MCTREASRGLRRWPCLPDRTRSGPKRSDPPRRHARCQGSPRECFCSSASVSRGTPLTNPNSAPGSPLSLVRVVHFRGSAWAGIDVCPKGRLPARGDPGTVLLHGPEPFERSRTPTAQVHGSRDRERELTPGRCRDRLVHHGGTLWVATKGVQHAPRTSQSAALLTR